MMRVTFLLILASVAQGFLFQQPQPIQCRGRALAASRDGSDNVERREIMKFGAAVLGALSVAGLASPVFAASPVINEIKIRESVKGVRDSVEALDLYKDFVSTKDFYGIKKSVRVPPVSDIRKDCRRVISGLEGKTKNDAEGFYKKFIESLETVDLMATRAIQNDNQIKDEDLKVLTQKYADVQTNLGQLAAIIEKTPYATPINVRLETEP